MARPPTVGQRSRDFGDLLALASQGPFGYLPLPYPHHLIEEIEGLTLWNPTFSRATSLRITNVNTGFSNFVYDENGKASDEGAEILNDLDTHIYNEGHIDGLIDHGLLSHAIAGAKGWEWVVAAGRKGIERVVCPPIQTIRFRREGRFDMPYQLMPGFFTQGSPEISLNPVTFHYSTLRTHLTRPSRYGIPPFLSAIEEACRQKGIRLDLDWSLQKFGLLGLVHIMTAIPPRNGESETEYAQIVNSYLEGWANQFANTVEKSGVYVTPPGEDYQIDSIPLTRDQKSVDSIYGITKDTEHEALGSPGPLHGRINTYTESLFNGIMRNWLTEVKPAGKDIARSIEYGHALHLRLIGFPFSRVEFRFKKPKPVDPLAEAQAFMNNMTTITMAEKNPNTPPKPITGADGTMTQPVEPDYIGGLTPEEARLAKLKLLEDMDLV